ncbi:MAG: hypothetical protein ACLR4Z_12020 [Butyricicoccaceae bacterium]
MRTINENFGTDIEDYVAVRLRAGRARSWTRWTAWRSTSPPRLS